MRIRFDTKTIHVPRNGKCLEYPAISLGLTTPNSSIIHREVLIDTGASCSTVPLSLARHLALDLDSLQTTTFMSVSGQRLTGYIAKVTMSIRSPDNSRSGWDWEEELILADIRSSLFGVLGHGAFLEYFKFELDAEEESFFLEDNSRFPGEVLTDL